MTGGRSATLTVCAWVLLLDPAVLPLGMAAVRESLRLPETVWWVRLGPEAAAARADSLQREIVRTKALISKAARAMSERQPAGPYIVVDTGANRLLMWKDGEVAIEAVCSTGSGKELVAGKRRWVFNTPRGKRKVLAKIPVPTWNKPDWAFIEDNKKVPPAGSPDRLEDGVLGEYGLAMGDGYLIHGTLYKRFLGQSVTHGCVRLDDGDLEQVYQNVMVGTPIYLF